ncbi:hypothetical protein AGLY_008682 [Aphis glycines]|uniref:Uncharacterized protein n=1 Tax=Aphis glycines TaxID=307491 RepID=A0A6G0TL23_APHGL|nr:hypothetical protein AGLY_008682 [Aphis glycines]
MCVCIKKLFYTVDNLTSERTYTIYEVVRERKINREKSRKSTSSSKFTRKTAENNTYNAHAALVKYISHKTDCYSHIRLQSLLFLRKFLFFIFVTYTIVTCESSSKPIVELVHFKFNTFNSIILQWKVGGNCLESAHGVDQLIKNQDLALKEINFSYDKLKIYNMSNYLPYWPYTREQLHGQLLNMSDPSIIKSTNFNAKNPIKILVHDWLSSFHEKE